MAYNKKTWISGEIITKEALDNIENGIEDLDERLENLDMSDKQDKTDNNLITESKDIVGAINELFQNANNGKEIIADAIGEPLNAEDTFAAMGNDIKGLLSTFKINMINNGVTVESGDKFKSLIDKLTTLSDNKNGQTLQYEQGTGSSETLSVSLNFSPVIIIAECKYHQSSVDVAPDVTQCYYNSFIHENNYSRIGITMGDSFRDHVLTSFNSYNTVEDKTFKFKAYRNDSVPTTGTYAWTWFALGVEETAKTGGYYFNSDNTGVAEVTLFQDNEQQTYSAVDTWTSLTSVYTSAVEGRVKFVFKATSGNSTVRVKKISGSTTTYPAQTTVSNGSPTIYSLTVDIAVGDKIQLEVNPSQGYPFYKYGVTIVTNVCEH